METTRILNPNTSGGVKLNNSNLFTIDILHYDGSVDYKEVGAEVNSTGSETKFVSKLNHRTFFDGTDYFYATEADTTTAGDTTTDQNCEPYIFSTRGSAYDSTKDPKETYSQANRGIEIGGLSASANADPNLDNWSIDGNVNSDGEGGGFKYNYGIQCTQDDYKAWAFGGNDMKKENKVINSSKTPNGKEYESSRGRVIGVVNGTATTIDGGTNVDNLMASGGNEFIYNIGAAGYAYSVSYDDSDYLKQLIDEGDGSPIAGYSKVTADGSTKIITKDADGNETELVSGDAYNLSNTMSKSYNSYTTVVKPLTIRNLTEA